MKKIMEAYFAPLRGKEVTVVGVGVSNAPLIRMLAACGARVTAIDRNEKLDRAPWEALGVRIIAGEDYLENISGEIVFRTPGLHPRFLADAVSRGAVLTSEMEAFFAVCPCDIIGVTGSDGKTTTTTLIAEMLKKAGKTVHVGGNIGAPLLPRAQDMRKEDIAVVELSSFQLMTMQQSPAVAVVTNVTPNHLDIHTSMAEYVDAKRNIFRHPGNKRLVLSADNKITRNFAPKAVFFSRVGPAQIALKDGVIYDGERPILPVNEILLPGVHNIENYMAAIGAVLHLADPGAIRETARTFPGVPHRLECVGTHKGVTYYNDSIASSPTRTLAGLRSFSQKVILIAGGSDKHIPFDPLAEELSAHVKTLVLNGATADAIRLSAESVPYAPPILQTDTLANAVKLAVQTASEGDIVLMSPACPSFDQFKNFEERGEVFKALVSALG